MDGRNANRVPRAAMVSGAQHTKRRVDLKFCLSHRRMAAIRELR